ncbi:MAG: excalibur calcium-binding domain-containing protein [Desulfobulbaceae bacterium]
MVRNIIIILIVIIIWLAYVYDNDQDTQPNFAESPQTKTVLPDFNCVGKKNCAEMISCEEAKFYLRNCPDVAQLDPDKDSVPCEDLCANR